MRSFLKGLKRTREKLIGGMAQLVVGKKTIDDALFEDIETCLLTADVGVHVTEKIMQNLTQKVKRNALNDSEVLFDALKQEMMAVLTPHEQPLILDDSKKPYVILLVGINGAGKTTTIGKLASRFKSQGKKVMLAAGDTFRAAAIEQLQTWGERNDIPVVTQHSGADSAAVIFDAIQSAQAKEYDVLIADTAGRLHTQSGLMDELIKIKRVITKVDDTAPHETLLVLDAGVGQNAIQQVKQFNEAINVDGLVLTKLDGTAKGGVIFALADAFDIPFRFIGVGEGIDDLKPFDTTEFVDALFDIKSNSAQTA